MLKLPEWRTFQEQRVTVYQDDTLFWKFYLVPNYVTIRKDDAGKPVFLLIAYSFGDQDREENPDLPRGGGYMCLMSKCASIPRMKRSSSSSSRKMSIRCGTS